MAGIVYDPEKAKLLDTLPKFPPLPQLKPLPLVTREEWGAVPPVDDIWIDDLEQPITNVIMTLDSGTTATCKRKEDCIKAMQDLQNIYMKYKKKPDIPYNFVIGNDGNVYEGRGWGFKPEKAAEFKEYYDHTVDIGVISGHVNEPLNKRIVLEHESIELANHFIDYNVQQGIISKDFDFIAYTGKQLL